MENKKGIIAFLIISIITIISISTYAWMTWSSPENTELTITIGDVLDVIFKKGDDVNVSNIGPVLNPEVDGVITEFIIVNKSSDELITMISLDITTLPTELQEDSFKYKILSSTDNTTFTEIKSGTFKDMTVGNNVLLEENPSIVGRTYYRLIIYIDGNMENPTTMMGQTFSGIINVNLGKSEPIADHVMSLSQGEGWSENASGVFKTSEGDYRYVGANVDNYVSFNNDLYRIIGVFDEKTHGQTGQQLVKLIAANLLSANSWGVHTTTSAITTYSNYKNDWTGDTTGVKANLNVLLNDFFYTKERVHATYGECGEWTYFQNANDYKTKDCSDIIGYGIDSSLQSYISDARWYLYGYTGSEYSKQNFYQCERGLSSDTTNCLVGGTTSAPYSAYEDAKIGLMYASDYLYASSAFSSTDETTALNQSKYGNQNWLYKGHEWTITPIGGHASNAVYVRDYGSLYSGGSSVGDGFRPTFYLKSNVYVTGGEGTKNKPYTIIIKE